jgi:hypothetical protein
MVNTEMFDMVSWTNTATNRIYKINPRNSTLFPWLSAIANCYDMYHIDSMTFRYVPAVGSTTPGQITLAIDYDATDDNTNTAPSVLQAYAGSVTGQVYAPMECTFHEECTVLNNHKYFNSSSEVPDRLSDIGNLIVRLIPAPGTPNDTVFGSLHVRYVVTFHDPERGATYLSAAATERNRSSGTAPVAATVTAPFGVLASMAMEFQKSGFNETTLLTKYPELHDGITMIHDLSSAFKMMSRAHAEIYRPNLVGNDWSLRDPATGARSAVAFAAVPGDDVTVVGPEVSDFLVLWTLHGTWTPTVADAPVAQLTYNGANIFTGWEYCAPWSTASNRIQVGADDVLVGYAFVHKLVGAEALISFAIGGAGVWSFVKPKSDPWSCLRLIPCPSVAY